MSCLQPRRSSAVEECKLSSSGTESEEDWISCTNLQTAKIGQQEYHRAKAGEDLELELTGYEKGKLVKYFSKQRNAEVDCTKSIQVIAEINPHELKEVDNRKSQFSIIFVLKFWWVDPHLKGFETVVNMKDRTELKGRIQRVDQNGDITLSLSTGEIRHIPKNEYITMMHEEEPDWTKQFFPHYSFLNIRGDPEPRTLWERYKVVWSHPSSGSFVCWEKKMDATFDESLQLQDYPLDRQLCRIRLSAERAVEEFQFVTMIGAQNAVANVDDQFAVDKDMQSKCTTYVRWADADLPWWTQRSRVHALFHLERRGEHFIHNVVSNIVLVNLLALCACGLPAEKLGSALGLLSACFLAVLAQRYLVNEDLPRKQYMTAADKYLTWTGFYQLCLCLSMGLLFSVRGTEEKDEEPWRLQNDHARVGVIVFFILWQVGTTYWWFFRSHRKDWRKIYEEKKEPYAPVVVCRCGHQWPAVQADLRPQPCASCGAQDAAELQYFTPQDVAPLVAPQKKPQMPN